MVVVLNNDYEEHRLDIHVRRIGVPDGALLKRIILTGEEGYDLGVREYEVKNNVLNITVPKISAVVLRYDKI